MTPRREITAKRPVNLTLKEDLVIQARRLTGNLSGVVESLLADFLAKEKQRSAAQAPAVKEAVATWNKFTDEYGSFGDDQSTF